jgi:DNA-binding transcriptional regulator LsrR (DeoR family)
VADAIASLPACDVVQLVGGVSNARLDVNGVEVLRRFAEKTQGQSWALHAPLLVRSASVAEELREEPGIARTLERYTDLSVALVGVGSWAPPQSTLYAQVGAEERKDLESRGATADLCTLVLDAQGTALSSPSTERSVGITENELRRLVDCRRVARSSGLIGPPKRPAAR